MCFDRPVVFPSPLPCHNRMPTSCGYKTCSCIYCIQHKGSCTSSTSRIRHRKVSHSCSGGMWLTMCAMWLHEYGAENLQHLLQGHCQLPLGLGMCLFPLIILMYLNTTLSIKVSQRGSACTEGKQTILVIWSVQDGSPIYFWKNQGPWPLCHGTEKFWLTQNLRNSSLEFRAKPQVLLLEASQAEMCSCFVSPLWKQSPHYNQPFLLVAAERFV